MSLLNTNWIVENFKNSDFTFFEIGTAALDKDSPSYQLKELIPNGKYYAFEAAEYWHEINESYALEEGINYFKYAVSDVDGEVLLYPSLTQQGEPHFWSSSIFKLNTSPGSNPFDKLYGEPYFIKSIKLETFCNQFNVTPDFIHMDVEGAELKALQNMGKHKPKCIWAEICAFNHYDTNTSFDELDGYLKSIGYYLVCIEETQTNDALYCLNEFKITNYK